MNCPKCGNILEEQEHGARTALVCQPCHFGAWEAPKVGPVIGKAPRGKPKPK